VSVSLRRYFEGYRNGRPARARAASQAPRRYDIGMVPCHGRSPRDIERRCRIYLRVAAVSIKYHAFRGRVRLRRDRIALPSDQVRPINKRGPSVVS